MSNRAGSHDESLTLPAGVAAARHAEHDCARFGTLAWGRATGGQLSARERLCEAVRGTQVLLRTLPAQLRQRLGFANPRARAFDLERLTLPDSRIARDAEQHMRAASSPALVTHCFRTYVWGALLGEIDGHRPDQELLFVAAMLHDLALTDAYRDVPPGIPCFGVRGAVAASAWAAEQGWPEQRCTKLGDAISLHLNVAVPAQHGPEAQLLQAGAGLDVIGLRHWELAPPTVDAVLARYPRHGMKRTSYPLFENEARPRTRAQLLTRWLMFGTLVRHAPFAE
jgi:hypothetical protein